MFDDVEKVADIFDAQLVGNFVDEVDYVLFGRIFQLDNLLSVK